MKKVDNTSALTLIEETELKSLVQADLPIKIQEDRNVVENVEIVPAVMTFLDAYEGKEFTRRITLRNVGPRTATVRIGAPTANVSRKINWCGHHKTFFIQLY